MLQLEKLMAKPDDDDIMVMKEISHLERKSTSSSHTTSAAFMPMMGKKRFGVLKGINVY